jgi:hypothetical protein
VAITVTLRRSNVEGNKRVVTMAFAGDTSGTIETGLSYVDYANISGWGTSDVTAVLYKNSNTTTNDNGQNGSVHLTGVANTALGYRLTATGV